MTTGAINIALTEKAGYEGAKTIVATLGTAVNAKPARTDRRDLFRTSPGTNPDTSSIAVAARMMAPRLVA